MNVKINIIINTIAVNNNCNIITYHTRYQYISLDNNRCNSTSINIKLDINNMSYLIVELVSFVLHTIYLP